MKSFALQLREDDAQIPAVRLRHASLSRGVPKHPPSQELRISQAVAMRPLTVPTEGFHPLVRVHNLATLSATLQRCCPRAEVPSAHSLLPHLVEMGRGKGVQEERGSSPDTR